MTTSGGDAEDGVESTPDAPGGRTRRDRFEELRARMRATARRDLEASEEGYGIVGDPWPSVSRWDRPASDQKREGPPDHVPYGVALAASWSWRLIVISAVVLGACWLLGYFSEITIPLAIAVLITALAKPFADLLERVGLHRGVATLLVMVLGIAAIAGALTLVGQQISSQFGDLRDKVVDGINEVQDWAHNGPLQLTDAQLERYVDRVVKALEDFGSSSAVSSVTEVGSTITHFFAGFFIVIFATYFFIYQGGRIWDWVVRLFPRDARGYVDTSGGVAWASLTSYVRATVLVALVDALGIAIVALVLRVPLVLAIAALVFLGAFIPIVGAFLSGLVAVLVALVAQGPWTAVFMLLGVIAVQQIEAHVLQPFLMGHLVALHPLAIILTIAAGVTVAGIVGGLLSVPIAACVNAVVHHLAERANQTRAGRDDGGGRSSPPTAAETETAESPVGDDPATGGARA